MSKENIDTSVHWRKVLKLPGLFINTKILISSIICDIKINDIYNVHTLI